VNSCVLSKKLKLGNIGKCYKVAKPTNLDMPQENVNLLCMSKLRLNKSGWA